MNNMTISAEQLSMLVLHGGGWLARRVNFRLAGDVGSRHEAAGGVGTRSEASLIMLTELRGRRRKEKSSNLAFMWPPKNQISSIPGIPKSLLLPSKSTPTPQRPISTFPSRYSVPCQVQHCLWALFLSHLCLATVLFFLI